VDNRAVAPGRAECFSSDFGDGWPPASHGQSRDLTGVTRSPHQKQTAPVGLEDDVVRFSHSASDHDRYAPVRHKYQTVL